MLIKIITLIIIMIIIVSAATPRGEHSVRLGYSQRNISKDSALRHIQSDRECV